MDTIKKLTSWVFSRKVLPYWVILAIDTLIVFTSCLFAWWVMHLSDLSLQAFKAALLTSLLFSMLSWIGARIFRTYSGVLRYSSFVDLLKLVYANAITLVIALSVLLVMQWQEIGLLSGLTVLQTLSAFIVATMLMWALRLLVKLMFDAFNTDTHALRTLIYGALTGGVGIAKNIRSQTPAQFELSFPLILIPRLRRSFATSVQNLCLSIRKKTILKWIMTPLKGR